MLVSFVEAGLKHPSTSEARRLYATSAFSCFPTPTERCRIAMPRGERTHRGTRARRWHRQMGSFESAHGWAGDGPVEGVQGGMWMAVGFRRQTPDDFPL